MAIVGEEIEKYVKDQIIARQKLHGSGTSTNRTNEQITLLNSQNAWVKLASGVSVTEEKCNELGVDPGDNKEIGLAKNNVLFGGLSKLTGTTLQQKSNFLPGTYSNSSDGFGIVPMPGIESVNIKTLTRGSVKSATIKMKAYSRDQYYILDTLYLRLGYIVLLEWGNNIYTTDGTDKNNLDYTVIEDKDGFFDTSYDNKGKHTSKIVGKIGSLRRKYQGNYDGMLGQITNFNWTFKDDGSYDISVEIHSLGSVIESLKLNQVVDPSLKKFAKDTDGVNVSDATEDQKGREKSYIHYVLWLLKYINEGDLDSNYVTMIDDNGNPQNLGQFLSTTKSTISTKTYKLVVTHLRYTDGGEKPTRTTRIISQREKDDMWGTIYDIFNTEGHYYGSDKADEYTRAWYAASGGFKEGGFVTYFDCKESGETTITNPFTGFKETDTFRLHCDPEYEYFIRFGALLKFIEEKIIPTIDKKDGDKIVSLSSTLSRMYFLPNQLSLDPRVCFLRNQVRVLKDDGSKFEIEIGKELERVLLPAPFIRKKEERNIGNAMNIYLNLNFVYESIDSNTDEKGNLSIFSFLSAICTRLNQVLGGINNLEPVIDEITNVCSIIDTTPIPGAVKDTGDYILDLYGYAGKNKDESNFIRKLDIKTAITPEYATMVTVGATAGGYTKGIEATAFNKWNKGIKDRFKERIVPSDNTKSDGTPKPTPAEEYYENYLKKKSQILGYDDSSRFPVSGQGDTISPDVIDRNLSIVPEFYKFALAEKTRSTKGDGVTGGTIGFIPFKLQFTMDGLAGIKIYNVLHIDTSFLPKIYGKSLNFIVTGYEHRLTKDDWETIITVNVMPKSTSSEDGEANNIVNYDFLEILHLEDLANALLNRAKEIYTAFKESPVFGTLFSSPKKSSTGEDVINVTAQKVDDIGPWNRTIPKNVSSTKDLGNKWQVDAANFVSVKEGFTKKAAWDHNAWRGGYGSDKVLKNGKLITVTESTTFTKKEASDTLANYSIEVYSSPAIKAIGKTYWDKLTNYQKVAIVDLAYNAGAYVYTARAYGRSIVKSIQSGDIKGAAQGFLNGPTTASGKVLPGLVNRRKEEAQLFLLDPNKSIYKK